MSFRSIRPNPASRLPAAVLPAAVLLGALLAAALAGCVAPPTSTVLSRLPEGQPGAATPQAHTLTPAEKQRYDAIDKQVLREQDHAMAAEAAARAYAYYAPVPVTVYGGYGGGYYGGWGGGWGTGVGYGYGYPGWGWGW